LKQGTCIFALLPDRNECEELRLKAISGIEDWDVLLYCNHHCHNIQGSYYCTCKHGFTLNSNRHTCQGELQNFKRERSLCV